MVSAPVSVSASAAQNTTDFFLFHSDFPLSGKTYIYVIYCFNHILEEIPYKNTSTYDSILVNMIVYILSSPIPGLIVRKQK